MMKKIYSLGELRDMQYYGPTSACEYLRRVRGIDFKKDSLRSIKRRRHEAVEAAMHLGNNTLWTREELDSIPITRWTKTMEPEKEEEFSSSAI